MDGWIINLLILLNTIANYNHSIACITAHMNTIKSKLSLSLLAKTNTSHLPHDPTLLLHKAQISDFL